MRRRACCGLAGGGIRRARRCVARQRHAEKLAVGLRRRAVRGALRVGRERLSEREPLSWRSLGPGRPPRAVRRAGPRGACGAVNQVSIDTRLSGAPRVSAPPPAGAAPLPWKRVHSAATNVGAGRRARCCAPPHSPAGRQGGTASCSGCRPRRACAAPWGKQRAPLNCDDTRRPPKGLQALPTRGPAPASRAPNATHRGIGRLFGWAGAPSCGAVAPCQVPAHRVRGLVICALRSPRCEERCVAMPLC